MLNLITLILITVISFLHVGTTLLQLPFSKHSLFVGPSKWYPTSHAKVTISPAQ